MRSHAANSSPAQEHYRPGGPQHPILILEKLRAVRVWAETIDLASQVHATIPMPSPLACSPPGRSVMCGIQRAFIEAGSGRTRPLSCFGCSGSLPVNPLAALGIFPRARAVFERLAPFVIGKLALHR